MLISILPEALAPLVEQIVTAVVAKLDAERASIPAGRLAYSEPEAAGLLGIRPHQLRDERLRGRVKASVGPGRRILYTPADLTAYLASRRWEEGDAQ